MNAIVFRDVHIPRYTYPWEDLQGYIENLKDKIEYVSFESSDDLPEVDFDFDIPDGGSLFNYIPDHLCGTVVDIYLSHSVERPVGNLECGIIKKRDGHESDASPAKIAFVARWPRDADKMIEIVRADEYLGYIERGLDQASPSHISSSTLGGGIHRAAFSFTSTLRSSINVWGIPKGASSRSDLAGAMVKEQVYTFILVEGAGFGGYSAVKLITSSDLSPATQEVVDDIFGGEYELARELYDEQRVSPSDWTFEFADIADTSASPSVSSVASTAWWRMVSSTS